MKILIDADACPVVREVEEIAKKYSVSVVLLCDTSHIIKSEYSTVKVIGKGADAVDFALLNMCDKGDVVVTQDYGVAAMVLGKGCYVVHQSGLEYTDKNIDMMLLERHINKKNRLSKKKTHIKGAKKRTKEDDERFTQEFEKVIRRVID